MACESFITTGPAVKSSNVDLQLFSRSTFNALISSLYPSQSCANIAAIVSGFSSGPANGVLLDGATFTKGDLTFDLSSNTYIYSLFIDGVAYGTWNVVGGLLVDNTTYGNLFTMGPGNIGTFEILPTFSISSVSGAFNNVVTAFDAVGYTGCVIPACALAPVSLPQIGGAVKCANFSKIFNPLGIPLRRK